MLRQVALLTRQHCRKHKELLNIRVAELSVRAFNGRIAECAEA
jgi:hypothetical protein